MRPTFHESMIAELREFGGVMRSDDLARLIAERDLYWRRGHAQSHQLRARAVRYRGLCTPATTEAAGPP